ncbi:permease [Thomasclavelia ramosa]|uniref:permease n=1 Tax=Thomasclavelia ramosa TaxID=1547 RepID=UPI0018A8BA58|nr:permease [Thomasclavelia ramosa]
MSQILLFFQDQILGMRWLNELIGSILTSIGLNIDEKIGGMLHFFIYDSIKIFILLSVLIYIISYIQSYFPPEKTKKILGRFYGIWANILGALLGTVTPFCSCSSIPIFMGFTSAGLPLGVTFSFLISSPMVDLGALILLMSIFGWKVAVLYVIAGLIISVVGGRLIEKLGMDDQVADFIKQTDNVDVGFVSLTVKDRRNFAKEQVIETVKKVSIYIFVGVATGSVIHNVIPEHWIQYILGDHNFYSVPLATVVGVPMYADIFGTIPIAESLLLKGAGLGTVLSFMMAVTTLSLPSMIMLSKAVKRKFMIVFVAIVTVGIISVGFMFNIFSFLLM